MGFEFILRLWETIVTTQLMFYFRGINWEAIKYVGKRNTLDGQNGWDMIAMFISVRYQAYLSYKYPI